MPDSRAPGNLHLDLKRYKLTKDGRTLRLEKIPMELLILLVQKREDLVRREEIVARLWGKDVFLDTDQGVNTAIRKIRLALGDDPEQPRYVQTVVGKGYRFVGPIEITANDGGDEIGISKPVTPLKTPASLVPAADKGTHTGRNGLIGMAAVALIGLLLSFQWRFDGLSVRQRLFGQNPPTIRSLAVLPLENLSGDHAQEYFADGMTDELITNLAKIGSLRVISRTSAMRYKGVSKPLVEIAHELNVDAVVEGSVVKSGTQVRITAQLIYVPTDRHLWAEEYQRDQRDILKLQSEVARTIVQEIRATITPEEDLRLTGTSAIDPNAYEQYLRGRSYWNQRNEGGLRKAVEQFTRAIEVDPTCAQAYSGLADSYTTLGYLSYLDPNDAFPRAKAAADKALELDPNLAEAHASLAYYNLYHAWNWPEAEKEFRRAIALNPNYATAHEWYSIYLLVMGRSREAWSEINHASELDPLSVIIGTDVGFHYFYKGEYDNAINQLRGTLATNPKFPLAHLWLGRAYQQKHMYAEAIAEFDQANTVLPDWVVTIAGTGNAYGEWGKNAEARAVLAHLNQLARQKYVTPYGVALIHAGLGEKEEAFIWLQKSLDARSHWLVWLELDPRWGPLRSDPRFHQLTQQIGLPGR